MAIRHHIDAPEPAGPSNASLSLANIAGIFMGYIPAPQQHPIWWIMMIGVLGSIVFLGRNIYCQQICPFMVVQDLAQKISGVKLKIDSRFQKRARTLNLIIENGNEF